MIFIKVLCRFNHLGEGDEDNNSYNFLTYKFTNVEKDSVEIIETNSLLVEIKFKRYGREHHFTNVRKGRVFEQKNGNTLTLFIDIDKNMSYKLGDYIVVEGDAERGYGCSLIVGHEGNNKYLKIMFNDKGNDFTISSLCIGSGVNYKNHFKTWRYATPEEIKKFKKKISYRNDIIFDIVNSRLEILQLDECVLENKNYFYPNCDIVYEDYIDGKIVEREGKFICYQRDEEGIQSKLLIKLNNTEDNLNYDFSDLSYMAYDIDTPIEITEENLVRIHMHAHYCDLEKINTPELTQEQIERCNKLISILKKQA